MEKTVAELKEEAKKLGIQGFANFRKDELIEAIEEAKANAEAEAQDQEDPKENDSDKEEQKPKEKKTGAKKVAGKYQKFEKGN